VAVVAACGFHIQENSVATNPNDYCGEPIYSKDPCSLMRRINTLEINTWDVYVEDSAGRNPMAMILWDDELYVVLQPATFFAPNSVKVYGIDGTFDRGWDLPSSEFDEVFISAYDDEIYIFADFGSGSTYADQMKVYNTSGALQRSANLNKRGRYSWVYDDEIYIPQPDDFRVGVYDLDGVFQRAIGTGVDGSGNGDFSSAWGVTELGGEIYVTDAGDNDRVQVFEPDGTYVRQWAAGGDAPTVIRAYNGNLFVQIAGASVSTIFTYESDGTIVQKFLIAPNTLEDVSVDGIYGRRPDLSDDWWARIYKPYQTVFAAYQRSRKIEFIPDGGFKEPVDNSLSPSTGPFADPDGVFSSGARHIENHITDMRTAIEELAEFYINADTGAPFNWTDEDEDNLYFKAMGDRTKYGATGGAKYDWTRIPLSGAGALRDIDIGEVFECIELLEASDLVAVEA
jgi:hypothetical protein